jgi:hypothetical protein
MYFNIIGNLMKLDPNRGKMASVIIKDNRKGQHWIVYLDLCKSDFADLTNATIGCEIEAKGFIMQKGNKTFFVAKSVKLLQQ